MALEVNTVNLQKVQGALERFVMVLDRHKWIQDLNTVGFYTENMWDCIVVPHFRETAHEIAQLTDTEMTRLIAGQLKADRGSKLPNLQQYIEECMQHRLENTNVLCSIDRVLKEIENARKQKSDVIQPVDESTSSSSRNDDDAKFSTSSSVSTLVKPRALMNLKKSHEVGEMSQCAARLANAHKIQKVVDIGSGKGYLGQYLTHQYGLDVIGIDSSDSNTHGARERNLKLLKKWKGLTKHSADTRSSQSRNLKESFKEMLTKRAHKRNKILKSTEDSQITSESILQSNNVSMQPASLISRNEPDEANQAGDWTVSGSQNAISQSKSLESDPIDKYANYSQTNNQSSGPLCLYGNLDVAPEESAFEELLRIKIDSDENNDDKNSPITEKCVTNPKFPETCQNQRIYNDSDKNETAETSQSLRNSPSSNCVEHKSSANAVPSAANFCPVTAFVEPCTSLASVVAQSSSESQQENEIPFILIGLHTCGDLAPSSLRLFVHNEMAQVLLNVGCCYQHLTEEFETEGWCVPEVKPDVCGFPMSSFLRSRLVKVTRPARMLASMASERIAESGTVPVMGLFYRSVLQVLLRDHFRLPTRSENVGKLAPKCKSFLEYARKALKKLGFDNSKLSDAEIKAYSVRYEPYLYQLRAVTTLRIALAPTVEGLIMLDRLCYLQEQANVQRAAIVRLFDPVISPRCYAIVAMKYS